MFVPTLPTFLGGGFVCLLLFIYLPTFAHYFPDASTAVLS